MAGTTCSTPTEYLEELRACLGRLDPAALDRYVDCIVRAWREDRAVWLFGNGGSASCASHHVADYVKTAQVDGCRRLRAFSLVDNTEMLTALGNDESYDEIFVHALETYARAGDVAVAISCSGNSENVLRAARWAREHALVVAALTGFDGGRLGPLADIHVNIPHTNFGVIEDIQLSLGHVVTQALQSTVAAEERR